MDREGDEEDKEAIGQRIGKLDRIESEEINFFAFNCDYILLLYIYISIIVVTFLNVNTSAKG